MNLLQNMLKKQDNLLEVELLISDRSTSKLIHRNPENDLDIMLACTLFYAKLLTQMTTAERNTITGFFLGLNKVALEMNAGYVELSCSAVNAQNIRSKVSIKLSGKPGEKKELRFSKLNKAILYQYILQFFRFTLGNISTVYRQPFISTFLALSKMNIEEKISQEEVEERANSTLLGLYYDAA